MKAFITGISGFVGAGLARHLLKEGVEVHGMVRPSSNLWRLEDIKEQIHLHEGDLLDNDSVARAMSTTKPDVVFHLAVHGAYPSQKDAEKILSTTILSTLHLLNVAKAQGVKMFVNTGSSSEYGTKDHPMREDERIDPNSYYAVGKAAQTHLCQHFSRAEGLPAVTMRLFSVYGPYEEPERLVPTIILNALSNKEIVISDPKVARDFIYLDDVARALYLASQNPKLAGEVLNLGTGVEHTLGDMADAVIEETKTNSKYKVGGSEKRSFDTYTWVANTEKLSSLLGFTPSYNLEQGVVESVSWFKQHANIYKK